MMRYQRQEKPDPVIFQRTPRQPSSGWEMPICAGNERNPRCSGLHFVDQTVSDYRLGVGVEDIRSASLGKFPVQHRQIKVAQTFSIYHSRKVAEYNFAVSLSFFFRSVDFQTRLRSFNTTKMFYKMLDFDILEQITIIRQTLAPLRLTRWQMFKSVMASVYRTMPAFVFLIFLSGGLLLSYFLFRAFTGPKDIEKLGLPILGGSKQHRYDFAQIVEEGRRKVSNPAVKSIVEK